MGRDVLDAVVLVVGTTFAVAGVDGLIFDQVREARATGRRFSEDLGWRLLWTIGLTALFVAAWVSGR